MMFFVAGLLTSLMSAPQKEDPLRVLCIGDSITQGGSKQRRENTFRLPLYRMISSLGGEVDFIGSQSTGSDRNFAWPEGFDLDHEAYGGAGMAMVRTKLRRSLLELPPPDIALIHLGTNDYDHHHDFARYLGRPLDEMIELLRARNPEVVILIGHLNFNGGNSIKSRPVFDAMAHSKSLAKSPVITVDHFRGWVENPHTDGHDCHDWVHPNPQGEQKMAEKWFAAMLPFLGIDTTRFQRSTRLVSVSD
tara:strand:+ start:18501 stop:19244 length:744 start_codon:yes stop_codon:yes gene_type:complete